MSKLPIKPMYGRILVKPHEEEPKTAGGILLSAASMERSAHRHGVVLAIGKDCKSDIQLADEIVFTRAGAPEVVLKGIKYCIVPDDAVIGVMTHE
jgi:co-chaperonin GroES (HSP10)